MRHLQPSRLDTGDRTVHGNQCASPYFLIVTATLYLLPTTVVRPHPCVSRSRSHRCNHHIAHRINISSMIDEAVSKIHVVRQFFTLNIEKTIWRSTQSPPGLSQPFTCQQENSLGVSRILTHESQHTNRKLPVWWAFPVVLIIALVISCAPGVSSVIGYWPPVNFIPDVYRIGSVCALGSPYGMAALVIIALLGGWILVGLFFVADAGTFHGTRDLQDTAKQVQRASSYLLRQPREYAKYCKSASIEQKAANDVQPSVQLDGMMTLAVIAITCFAVFAFP